MLLIDKMDEIVMHPVYISVVCVCISFGHHIFGNVPYALLDNCSIPIQQGFITKTGKEVIMDLL